MSIIPIAAAGAGAAPATESPIPFPHKYDPVRMGLKEVVERIQKAAEVLKREMPCPEFLKCPINLTLMRAPTLVAPCGHTFEKGVIEDVVKVMRANCSICRTPITLLSPNHIVRHIIEEWLQKDPIPTFSAFKEEDPERAALSIGRGEQAVAAKNYHKALADYSEAFLHTRALGAYAAIPKIYEELERSEPALDKAVLAYLYLALYQLKENQIPEAIKTLEHAKTVKLDEPLKIDALLEGLRLLQDSAAESINAVLARAATLAETDPEEAACIYKQVLTYNPYCFEAYKRLIALLKDPEEKRYLLLKAAGYAEERGELELAADFCKQAAKLLVITLTPAIWADPARFKDQLPPYPEALKAFLAGPCPIWAGKTAVETHIVVPLFPTITTMAPDGSSVQVPVTLASLRELDKAVGGAGYKYILYQIREDVAEEGPFRWAVMTEDVLPDSRNKSYVEQQRLIPKDYEVPSVLNAATAILWQKRLGETFCFSDNPWTFTRCRGDIQDRQLVVGGFTPDGLDVFCDHYSDKGIGVAALRKF